jgi:hypothetical protein
MADDEETLTEELVISKGGQYDPELLQRLTLSGLRLARLGQGLARCSNLRVLDLARNRLQTLDGIEACRRLVRLRVAGNGLRSLGGVAGLADLEHLDARANALAAVDAVAAALRPCACLTSLELRADDGAEANPCCASQTYAATLRGALPALQVLDGGRLALKDAAAAARGTLASAAVDAAAPAPDDWLGDGFDWDAAQAPPRAANGAARIRADADRLRAEMAHGVETAKAALGPRVS